MNMEMIEAEIVDEQIEASQPASARVVEALAAFAISAVFLIGTVAYAILQGGVQ